MLSAKEVNGLTKKSKKNNEKLQMKEIQRDISNAIDNGEFFTCGLYELSPKNKNKLKSFGYHISYPDPYITRISWGDKDIKE